MFLAHSNEVQDNCYKPLAQYNKKDVLVNDAGVFSVKSNVCPHQLSLLSTEPGTGARVCPYHNWAFDISGNPLSSGRTSHYCQNTRPLSTVDAFQFKNMLFDRVVDCKELHWLDLSKMQLKEQRIDIVKADPKIIMDVFLDVDHIQAVHLGVYDLIDLPSIEAVQWHYYDWGSLQLVAKGEEYGAAWLAVYPGTMIEWQPGALFVTVAQPCVDGAKVHVFKYSDSETDWTLNEKVWETAWAQDKSQAELIAGFTQHNLEESKKHFRSWLVNGNS
jgi:phenylpropionate dioxygenase-like ring-hydroxylating dioxygenase large terminal subunit